MKMKKRTIFNSAEQGSTGVTSDLHTKDSLPFSQWEISDLLWRSKESESEESTDDEAEERVYSGITLREPQEGQSDIVPMLIRDKNDPSDFSLKPVEISFLNQLFGVVRKDETSSLTPQEKEEILACLEERMKW